MTLGEIIQAIHKQTTNNPLARKGWSRGDACGNRDTLIEVRKAANTLWHDIDIAKAQNPSAWIAPKGKREMVTELSYTLSALDDCIIGELDEEDVQTCLDGALIMCFACAGAGLPRGSEIIRLENTLLGH